MMNLEPFHRILNKAIGLSPESLGRTGVTHALSARMRATGCNEDSYLKLLRGSEIEQAELVEEIVVPETWFFRDGKPFDFLFETAFNNREGEFRVLSAPCSTGEEPYSIAMTLLGAGLEPSRFRVDGVDISRRALDKARNGIFTENSFRNDLPTYAQSYFRVCSEGRELVETVRKSVNFYCGNIVEGCLPSGKYDVIFCRNLLIYLEDKHKSSLAKQLSDRLKDGGLLFVGHAEILPVFNDWFTPVRRQGAFALRKGRSRVAELLKDPDSYTRKCRPDSYTRENSHSKAGIEAAPAVSNRKEKIEIKDVPSVAAKEQVTKPLGVEEVRRVADRGNIKDALQMCEEIIETSGPDLELYHLCGLLHEAQGNISMAEDCYGKALYLEPHHVESLVHLALLFENRGDNRRAELLRNRVKRAENR